MSNETKTCNLTEDEIKQLINYHGYSADRNIDDRIERMNYLHKRLKAFKEIDDNKPKSTMSDTQADGISAAAASNPNPALGWGQSNG